MIALALALATAPCTDVLDRTAACTAPDDEPTAVAPDVKGTEAFPRDASWDVGTLPAELGFVSAGLAFGGGTALVLGLATTATNDDERLAQAIATYIGTGMLAWSSLVGAGAFALWIFDPSTGAPRLKFFPEAE